MAAAGMVLAVAMAASVVAEVQPALVPGLPTALFLSQVALALRVEIVVVEVGR